MSCNVEGDAALVTSTVCLVVLNTDLDAALSVSDPSCVSWSTRIRN